MADKKKGKKKGLSHYSTLIPEDPKSARFLLTLAASNALNRYHRAIAEHGWRHDGLTNVLRREFIIKELNEAHAVAVKESKGEIKPPDDPRRKHQGVTILFFDLDHFKKVNDKHGHNAGDEVLREAGGRLKPRRESDVLLQYNPETAQISPMVGRYGGEEFLLILRGCDNIHDAMNIAEEYRQRIIGKPFETSAGPLKITPSIGVAVFNPSVDHTPIDFTQRADVAMYIAKSNGRNCIVAEDNESFLLHTPKGPKFLYVTHEVLHARKQKQKKKQHKPEPK